MGSKWKLGFKVVRETDDGKLVSMFITDENAVAEYGIDKVTRRARNNGPLGVFENLKQTSPFAGFSSSDNRKVFRCKYRVSKLTEFFFSIAKGETTKTGLGQWTPVGTRYASSVILIEDVTTSLLAYQRGNELED